MLKGTQVFTKDDAAKYRNTISLFSEIVMEAGYREVILPSIWEAKTFEDKIQGETKEQIWKFKDKGDRDVCLVPEITGIIQELYNSHWKKSEKKPIRLFYIAKCFRYERPQLGRLREFTQFGLECLSDNPEQNETEVKTLLKECLDDPRFIWKDQVRRGLGYYTANGFEVVCENLGAQKQIAGGGKYKEGIGWAIGIERILLSYGEASSVG